MALYRPRYSHGRYIFFAIGWYALAKALEHFDRQIYAATGSLAGGHALKHLAATMGYWVLVRMFTVREPLQAYRIAMGSSCPPTGFLRLDWGALCLATPSGGH